MTDEEIRIIGYAYMLGYQKGKENLANMVKNRIESEYSDTDGIKQLVCIAIYQLCVGKRQNRFLKGDN